MQRIDPAFGILISIYVDEQPDALRSCGVHLFGEQYFVRPEAKN
jgi:hypothetical protein